MRENLTVRQRSLLTIVRNFIRREGFSPSLRDLAAGLRCDHSTIREILIPLERKGYIVRKPKVSRSIRLLPAGKKLHPQASKRFHNVNASLPFKKAA